MNQNNKFNFFVPLEFEKGASPSKAMKVKGVCSSATEDSDGETLHPSGFNVLPLLSTGFLNYNHQASKSAAAIIGEPTKAEIINNGRDLYIEGFLYPDSDEAKAVYKLAQTLEKNSPNRRLGFSIEGKATKRDPFNEKIILAADITSVAITPCPKNPNTLLSIMKGEYQEPLQKEDDVMSDSGSTDITESMNKSESKCPNCGADLVGDTICKCMAKAITTETGSDGTNGGLQVEDVEGGKSVIDSIINSNRKLKKSEVYTEIVKAYPYVDYDQAKGILTFIETVNQKSFNMDTTDKEILPEALQKSFDILNQSFDLIKADAQTDVAQEAKTEPAAELEKSQVVKDLAGDDEITPMAQRRIEKGMSQEEAVADMVSKGISLEVAQTAVAKVISEAEGLDSNGDKNLGTAVTAPIVKSEDATIVVVDDIITKAETITPVLDLSPIQDLIKGQIESFETLIKGQSDEIGKRFTGVGAILKSMTEENAELKKANEDLTGKTDELQKSFDALAGRLNVVEKTPIPSNTVTTASVVERFNKSQDATNGESYSVSNKQDLTLLSDRLEEEMDLVKSKGKRDVVLEKAITDIEMLGGFQADTLNALRPRLHAMKINIVA